MVFCSSFFQLCNRLIIINSKSMSHPPHLPEGVTQLLETEKFCISSPNASYFIAKKSFCDFSDKSPLCIFVGLVTVARHF